MIKNKQNGVRKCSLKEKRSLKNNALTVLLYMVGTDLERKQLSESDCLLEIMEGISTFKGSHGISQPDVHFLVQTGGSCFDPADSVTGGGKTYARIKREAAFLVREGRSEDPLYLRRLRSIKKILWDRNERWEITEDTVIPMKVQPADGGRHLMTEKNENGCVSELLDFVQEAVAAFPADQYILIMCGHGGGPLWGFGEDERNDDEMILPSDICRTIPYILSATGKKLALVCYSSCFTSCPENLLAWKEGARSFLSSETDAGVKGWLSKGVINTLLARVNRCCPHGTLTDEIFDHDVLPSVIDKALSDHLSAAVNGQILSAFSLNEDKIHSFIKAYREFTGPIAKRLFESPVESFRALMQARLDSQKIDEYSTDLGSFAGKIGSNPRFSDIPDLLRLISKLIDSIKEMTLGISSTPDFDEEISGVFVFLPVTDSTTSSSNWEKYLSGLRKSEKNGSGLCDEFVPLADGILTLGGVFCAIREAGRLLTQPGNDVDEISAKLQAEIQIYGLAGLDEIKKLRDLPEVLVRDHALGLFEEGRYINARIKCRYKKRNVTFTKNRGLGYIPADNREEENDPKWFYAIKADGTSFLLHVYGLSGSNKCISPVSVFTEESLLLTPVLVKGTMMMLYIHFKEGADTGRVTKAAYFSFASDSLGKPFDLDKLKDADTLYFLGSVSEGERSEMTFFDDRPKDFVIAEAPLSTELVYKRGSIADNILPDYCENVRMISCIHDIFNGCQGVSGGRTF